MLKRLASLTGWRAGLAAAALGAVSAAALPPLFLVPVLLLTIPGLLLLVGGAPGPRGAGWRGFWFGFGLHLFGLYWITEAILIRAAEFWWLLPFAVPLVAAVLAVFIALPVMLARLAPAGWRRALVLAGGWVLGDIARQYVATGFPWNPLGSVWAIPGALGDVFIQPASWIGVHGLTLLTLLLAATPVLGGRMMAAGGVALAAWAGLGMARLREPSPDGPGVQVVLVQADVAEGQKQDQAFADRIFRRYLRLTREGVAQATGLPAKSATGLPAKSATGLPAKSATGLPAKSATGLPAKSATGLPDVVVVWPETASPFLLQQDPTARRMIMQAAAPARAALVGSVTFTQGAWSLAPSNHPQNSLLALTGDGDIAALYAKFHLVPFGEYQPRWLPLPIQIVPGGGFAPGPGPRTLVVPGLPPFGPLICYEAIFPAEVVDEADRPAWLVNITNDAWFGNSAGPRQHLAAARMRAVEEGLPLMRAANTGISAGFDARGRELGRLGLGRAGVLVLPLPGALRPTPFARLGLVIPGLLALAAVGGGLDLARKRPVPAPGSRRSV